MLKYLIVCVPAVVLALTSVASAQAPQPSAELITSSQCASGYKFQNGNCAPKPSAEVSRTSQCVSGFKFPNGSCLPNEEVARLKDLQKFADCMVQQRNNYTHCANVLPSGDYVTIHAKDWDVFGFGPAGIMSAPAASDIRLKLDIAQVGQLENGIKLYKFRYIWSEQVYVGVMAQQVAAIKPEAVVMEPNGYLAVYYDKLGLQMQTWDEWKATH
jgi:hypothetical protein